MLENIINKTKKFVIGACILGALSLPISTYANTQEIEPKRVKETTIEHTYMYKGEGDEVMKSYTEITTEREIGDRLEKIYTKIDEASEKTKEAYQNLVEAKEEAKELPKGIIQNLESELTDKVIDFLSNFHLYRGEEDTINQEYSEQDTTEYNTFDYLKKTDKNIINAVYEDLENGRINKKGNTVFFMYDFPYKDDDVTIASKCNIETGGKETIIRIKDGDNGKEKTFVGIYRNGKEDYVELFYRVDGSETLVDTNEEIINEFSEMFYSISNRYLKKTKTNPEQ